MKAATKKRKGRGPDRAIRARYRQSEKTAERNRKANLRSHAQPGKITVDEYEQIQNLKREARGRAFGPLLRKTVDVICDPHKTWGNPEFEAAAHYLGDRCGLPKETVQDLKLQAGTVPTIRFVIERPDKPGE